MNLVRITQGAVRAERRLGDLRMTETIHPRQLELPAHAHREASLSLVLRGAFDERVSDDGFRCEPLSLLYKPPGVEHSNRYGADGARTFIVSMRGAAFRRLVETLETAPPGPLLCSEVLAARALALFGSFGTGSTSALDWEELLASVLDQRGRECGVEDRRPLWLERVAESIHARFSEPLSLADLAAEAGVHPVHLARVHRRRFGASVGDAVRRRRIEHAVTRLRAGERNLAALALECGFADQSHLTRSFRREVATTPARFRRSSLRLLAGIDDGPAAR